MKFRIKTIKNQGSYDTYVPQLRTWLFGKWKSIIHLPHDMSDNPFELLEDGWHEYPTKEQAQSVIDAYKKYNNIK